MKQVIGMWMGMLAASFLFGCTIMCCDGNSSLVEGKKSLTVSHQAEAAIDVRTENGSIQVVKADRSDVEIVATIRARTQERLDSTTINARRGEDGVLHVTADWPAAGRRDNEGCSFEVAVPEAVGVVLESSNGALSIAGLAGAARLRTSNGAIHAADQDGPVEARTSNGGINVEAAQGTVDARSSNGRVTVSEATAAVKAETSNGSVTVRLVPANPGPVEARTSNGGIELDLSPAFSGELTLETSHGGIHAKDLPGARLISSEKDRLVLGFGQSDAKSTAKTSNGAVTVRMRGEAVSPEGS